MVVEKHNDKTTECTYLVKHMVFCVEVLIFCCCLLYYWTVDCICYSDEHENLPLTGMNQFLYRKCSRLLFK